MHDQSWENEKIIEIIIPDCYAQTFPTVCNAHDTPMKRATMKEQNRKIPKIKLHEHQLNDYSINIK